MNLKQFSTIQLLKSYNRINFLSNKTNIKALNLQEIMTALLAVTALSLALSISLRSVFIILASIIIVFHIFYDRRRDMFQALLAPWFFTAVLFFLIILVGCLTSPAPAHSQLDFINKYSKLFFLPLLAFGFQNKQNRFWAIHAFLLGMLITVICSELKVLGLVKMKGAPQDFGEVFYNHIVTGYYMAFAAFLAAVYAMRATEKRRVGYILAAILFSYHTLFINQGRTGYVMYAALLIIFLLNFMHRHLLKSLLILVPILLLAYQSPLVKEGVLRVTTDLQKYQHGEPDSPIGYRLQFHNYAQELFFRKPILGVGTAAFGHYFSVENPIPTWLLNSGNNILIDPHGEYWLIAAEHGLVGLMVFVLFILSLFYEIYQTDETRIMFLGLLVTFLIGCCSDGFLLLAGPGYLLIIFAAMGLGESLVTKQEKFAKQYILNREY
jgi:O-antigen ligase